MPAILDAILDGTDFGFCSAILDAILDVGGTDSGAGIAPTPPSEPLLGADHPWPAPGPNAQSLDGFSIS